MKIVIFHTNWSCNHFKVAIPKQLAKPLITIIISKSSLQIRPTYRLVYTCIAKQNSSTNKRVPTHYDKCELVIRLYSFTIRRVNLQLLYNSHCHSAAVQSSVHVHLKQTSALCLRVQVAICTPRKRLSAWRHRLPRYSFTFATHT